MADVRYTDHLRRFFPDLAAGIVPGETVRDVIDELERRHPGFASFVIDEAGRLRRHVNVFVGDEPVGDREKLTDRVGPEQRMFILQALSGG